MTGILDYAGPQPMADRSILSTLSRMSFCIVVFCVLCVYVAVRAVLLLAGFALVLIGTILLMIGGRRSATQKLAEWHARSSDLMRLWLADILRPLRRWRAPRPRPVLVSP